MKGDDSFADLTKLRVKRVDRVRCLTGPITFFKEITNDITCEVLLFKKQGGEYRQTPFKLPSKGFCDFYTNETYVVPEFKKYCADCPKQEDHVCPWKAVRYFKAV